MGHKNSIPPKRGIRSSGKNRWRRIKWVILPETAEGSGVPPFTFSIRMGMVADWLATVCFKAGKIQEKGWQKKPITLGSHVDRIDGGNHC